MNNNFFENKYSEFIKWKQEQNQYKGELFTGGQYNFVKHLIKLVETDSVLKKLMCSIGNRTNPFKQLSQFYKEKETGWMGDNDFGDEDYNN